MAVMDHPVLAGWLQLFGMLSFSGAAVFAGLAIRSFCRG
ncbi:Uncharacterised protein [Roseomonas gilardii subsp. rosea]|nr:Uncharacterised protein [Roseomonas gilardii subsp. rosea]